MDRSCVCLCCVGYSGRGFGECPVLCEHVGTLEGSDALSPKEICFCDSCKSDNP